VVANLLRIGWIEPKNIATIFPQTKEQDPKAEALADPVDEIGYGKPQLSQCYILYRLCLFLSSGQLRFWWLLRGCGFSSYGEFTRKTLVGNLLNGLFNG